MNHLTQKMLAVSLLAGVGAAGGADVTSSKFESKYYKDFPLFSTFAVETAARTPIEHFGPVGVAFDLLQPAFQMRLSNIEKGSPAEATGKLKVGQMIESINGQVLKDIDPRIILGAIITRAEATDGLVKFMVKETPEAKAQEVIVKIPVLGAYSKTPISPPAGPTQWLFQGPPAESKVLAAVVDVRRPWNSKVRFLDNGWSIN